MSRIDWRYVQELFHKKDDERNPITVSFHMLTITLIIISFMGLSWFNISNNYCISLTLGKFFWLGYSSTEVDYSDLDCVNSSIINTMRTIILFCFMAIICTFMNFIPQSNSTCRRYISSIATIVFVVMIIPMSYYVLLVVNTSYKIQLLKRSCKRSNLNCYSEGSFGLGFYLVMFAAGVQAVGLIYRVILQYNWYYRVHGRYLIRRDPDDDSCLGFSSSTLPPPPYSLRLPSPPPYSFRPPPPPPYSFRPPRPPPYSFTPPPPYLP